MRNPRFLRLAFWLAMALPTLAFGAAHATIHVVGDEDIDLSESISTDTAGWNYQFLTVDVSPGETITHTFHYTVSIADDGLPATRVDSICTPDYLTDCGPAATGFEQAYALIEIDRDRREIDTNSAFLVDGDIVQTFHSVTGAPQTFEGTLTYTATDESPYISQEAQLQVMLFALVDAAPVPEPAGWTMLLLAGLALAGSTSGRRPSGH